MPTSGRTVLDTNRRSEVRLRTPRIPVRVASHESFVEQYVHDLSRGGMFLVTDQLMEVGSEIEVDLYPPAWAEPLELRGVVVRVENDEAAQALGRVGMGIRLEGIPEWTKSRLDALLAQIKSQGLSKAPFDAGAARPKPPSTSVPEPVPASAVLTADELAEGRIAELESELVLARDRIDANVNTITRLEKEVLDARETTESLQRQKDALELELRHETERLNGEIEKLSNKRGGGKMLFLAVLVVPLSSAAAYIAFSGSDLAVRTRSKIQNATRSVTLPGMGQSADGGTALPTVVRPAPTGLTDAGSGEEAAPTPMSDGGTGGESLVSIHIEKGTVIFIDGKRMGRAPVKPQPLSAGMHRVRFTCVMEGKPIMTRPRYIRVPEGEELTVEYFCEDLVTKGDE
ncbi:MAG: PilZ domain-containing protein [Myxococcaceae bacterium]